MVLSYSTSTWQNIQISERATTKNRISSNKKWIRRSFHSYSSSGLLTYFLSWTFHPYCSKGKLSAVCHRSWKAICWCFLPIRTSLEEKYCFFNLVRHTSQSPTQWSSKILMQSPKLQIGMGTNFVLKLNCTCNYKLLRGTELFTS